MLIYSFLRLVLFKADLHCQMGFMTKAYPIIPSRIKAQMPPNNFNKDVEDDIVTTMLEELLAMSPKPPAASGSGLRKDRDIPGAWH